MVLDGPVQTDQIEQKHFVQLLAKKKALDVGSLGIFVRVGSELESAMSIQSQSTTTNVKFSPWQFIAEHLQS